MTHNQNFVHRRCTSKRWRIILLGVIVLSTTMEHTMASTSSSNAAAAAPIRKKRLTVDTINTKLKNMEYAVRGKIAIEAERITHDLSTGAKYPFNHIIFTNIGNPHAVQQKAITWPRQVMALLQLPDALGIDHPNVSQMFPQDAIDRARLMKQHMGGHGVGAYTTSKGVRQWREDVARFIEQRDGATPGSIDIENIFLTSGASEAIGMLMTALIKDSNCGIMTPIPQYPLYSATLDLLGGHQVGYYLDETSIWGLNMEEMERSLADAKAKGINVVGLVLINPGVSNMDLLLFLCT